MSMVSQQNDDNKEKSRASSRYQFEQISNFKIMKLMIGKRILIATRYSQFLMNLGIPLLFALLIIYPLQINMALQIPT